METSLDNILLNKFMQCSPDMICTIDAEGHFTQVSDACSNLLSYTREELEGKCFLNFVHPDDQALSNKFLINLACGAKSNNFQNRYMHKSGSVIPLMWSVAWSEEDRLYFCIARDASEFHTTKQRLQEKEVLYNALIEQGEDIISLIDKDGNYLYNGGAMFNTLGHVPEHLKGLNAFSFIHPDDVSKARRLFEELLVAGHASLPEFRFKTAAGKWKWLATVASNKLLDPSIQAIVIRSRDITERKVASQAIAASEQKYKSLFDNNPDIIFLEDKDGLVTEVNRAFCHVLDYKKEEVINLPASSFLPDGMASVNERSLLEANLGSTMRYDIMLVTKDNEKRIFDTIKSPIIFNNEIIGYQTIAKDITPVVHSLNTIQKQANKLNTIFESIKDAFCMLDKNWTYTYINSEFEELTKASKESFLGRSFFDIYPKGKATEFYKNYLYAYETGKSVRFEAFSLELQLWLDIKVFPSEEGISIYFNDITAKIKAKQELEKLSLVASKTTNGVIITDVEHKIEWVNQGFCNLTGYSIEEAIGSIPSELLRTDFPSSSKFDTVREKIFNGEPVAFDILNFKKTGEELWLSVQVDPIYDENNILVRYVTTQTDITALQKSKLELSELAKDLYRQNRDLQQFTYIVSHNLRAPVANVVGLASILKSLDRTCNTYDSSLHNLEISVVQLDNVLKDVNMVLSIRDSKDTLEKEPVNIHDVLQQAASSLLEPLQKCGSQLSIEIPEECSVSANRAYLHSIFYNLLSNSIKYRCDSRVLHIKVKCFGSKERGMVISFSDNGTGFDLNKAAPDLFKLYKRFHRNKEGRGIGLFLVKTHIEAMGGQIEVNSQPNRGTRFLIYLN